MAEYVLKIETKIERPKIDIDGVLYEIVSPEELPVETSYRIADLGKKLQNMMNTASQPEAQQKLMKKNLHELADIIMAPVPVDVRAALSDTMLHSVVEVFSMLLLERKVKLAGATITGTLGKDVADWLPEMFKSAGLKSPPGSSDISEAAPQAG